MSEKRIIKTVVSTDEDYQPDWTEADELSDEEVLARAAADPDAQPVSAEELQTFSPAIDVRTVRNELNMTQEQFARAFHLSLPTLRDWEQRRTRPDQAARTLLRVIAHNPQLVQRALDG